MTLLEIVKKELIGKKVMTTTQGGGTVIDARIEESEDGIIFFILDVKRKNIHEIVLGVTESFDVINT